MRSRLIALILLPTAIAVLVTGIQLTNAINTGAQYRRLTEVAQLIERLGTLSHEMATERDLTAWYIADRRRKARFQKVQGQHDKVDTAKGAVLTLLNGLDDAQGQRVKNKAATVQQWLNGLTGLRKLILESRVPARAAIGTYTRMIADFTTLHDELGRDSRDDRLFGDSVALGALSRAKEDLSQQIGILLVALHAGRFDSDDFSDFLAARERQDSELTTFRAEATPANIAFYNGTVRGLQVDEADRMRALVLARVRENRTIRRLTPAGVNDVPLWYSNATATVEKMRTVEVRLAGEVVRESTTLQQNEQRQALITGVEILILLLVVLLVTSLVARSLVRPLRRLRTEALEIAGQRLPDVVQFLRESGDTAQTPDIAPIGVSSRDEVGEVARAFDEVHREAIRLAGDEARLRSNVNAMFVNLSRRSQTLVERQLSLIESLEQGEEDENRLGSLFRLDHLATRMRRNSENLLVLAGQEPSRRWSQPVALVDIVRASLSEVENYERVTLKVQSGMAVAGQSVNDVVHLIAELVENAISFSPMETKVTVSANRVDGGGAVISVSDLGIGMNAEELAQANWRLANPPVVDVSVSRRMGLFVVGRLALRHGIRAQLRPQDSGGLTAMVLLPETLLGGTPGPKPGMIRADSTGPLPMFGLDPAPAFGTAPQPPSLNPGRTPVFGADAPGIPVPAPASDPFERGAFESVPFERDPFERDAFAKGAFERDPFERGPFERDPFEQNPFQQNPFEQSPFTNAPVDTPWPGHVPAPGSDSWQNGVGADTETWQVDRGAFGPGENDHTGPLPKVDTSPMESGDEFLPIFAAVESDWFRSADRPVELERAVDEEISEVEEDVSQRAIEPEPVEPRSWVSAADAGWQAAQSVKEPAMGGITSAGLPKRVPKANLVPGTAGAFTDTTSMVSPVPVVSPERVRSRLSSFQQGVRQGRAVARGEQSEDQPYPGIGPNDGYKEDA